MKIGIVGSGVVGSATAVAWRGHCDEVRVNDADPQKSNCSILRVLECDLVFVCLPETELDGFFRELRVRAEWQSCNFVLKSTVPIGTTRRLSSECRLHNLVHSPEFLSERTAVEDAANPKRLVVGCPRVKEEPVVCKCCHALRTAYSTRFPGVPLFAMSCEESEAVKLFDNAFGAVKVSLFNEFRSLSDELGLDWRIVLDALLAGGRIGADYTQVPGPDYERGWGGRCWPKDLDTLLDSFFQYDLSPYVCVSAKTRNYTIDRREAVE